MSTNTVTTTLPDYPLVYAEEPFIRLAVVYNPFDLTSTARHELVYGQSKSLADYMQGLPAEVEWNVAVDGELVPAEDWATTKPAAFCNITIVRVPEGGGGNSGKTILRVVALIAVMVFAAWAGPLIAGAMGVAGAATATTAATAGFAMAANAASAVIGVAGSMAVNMLLAPKAPAQEKVSTAYGLDGAKNSAREGVVVPVTYGDFRIGGNVIDLFTRNFGEDQYLYIRTALNDGEIEGVEEIELNGQPLSSYTDVQTRIRLGKPIEEPNDWFNETTRQFNRGSVITTAWTQHVTDTPVDRLRADVLFPEGLYFAKDDGRKLETSVTLALDYATVGENNEPNNDWKTMPLTAHRPVTPLSPTIVQTGPGTTGAQFIVQTAAKEEGSTEYEIAGEYREVGTTEWLPAPVLTGSAFKETVQSIPDPDFPRPPPTSTFPTVPYGFDFGQPGDYEVRVGGGNGGGSTGGGGTSVVGGYAYGGSNTTTLNLTGSSSRTMRLTYESTTLPRQRYAMRIRRLVADDDTDKRKDECWITDFGEIESDPTNVNGIANISLRVKMTEQLSGIPTLTCKLKGSKVNIYDEDGVIVGFEKSSNPADIVADILLNETRGANFSADKMVWPRYAEFREHCIAEGFTFNGTFDAVESMWDVAQTVAARGRAVLMPRGTKFSFSIDRAQEHSMLFTPSNIFKDTFKTTWLGTSERANEIQMVFFDEANGNKQRTIRVTDNVAFARGEKQRIATASGMGIVHADDAVREAEYAARVNRYIKKNVEFDAPIEAIGMGIGDVALVQHDSMDFKGGVGGRLAAGSTTTLVNIDRPAFMEADKDYLLMVIEAATKRFDCTITAIAGSRVTVTGLPAGDLARVRRLTQGNVDAEIMGMVKVGNDWRLTVGDTSDLTAGVCELWDTDSIEERDVYTQAGAPESLYLVEPLTKAPSEYANFMFGEKISIKQPFRLQAISGNDIDRRSLTFIQYDQRIYERGGFDTVETVVPARDQIGHVQGLIGDYDQQATPDQFRITTNLSWTRPSSVRYAGADIYTKVGEDASWVFAGSAQGTSTFQTQFGRGDVVKLKVVAFDDRGNRARFEDAPQTSLFLAVFEQTLEAPQNVSYSVPYFRVDATAQIAWDAPSDALSTSYRVSTKVLTEADYDLFQSATDAEGYPASVVSEDGWISVTSPTTSVNLPQLNVGYRIVRVRGERNLASSPWVYLGVEIVAPAVPTAITGLRLDGHVAAPTDTFPGQDAKFVWDDIMDAAEAGSEDPQSVAHYFRDYRVRVLTTAGALIREETTVNPSYAYTIEKNVEDRAGVVGPRGLRAFKIEVTMRGRQGQISDTATMTVSNPAPAVAPLLSVTTGMEGFTVELGDSTDNDVVGNLLYVSTASGFTPGSTNLVFQGPGSPVFVGVPLVEYYFRYASYDAFGVDALSVSPEYSATTNGISSDHFDPAFLDLINADVTAASNAAIDAANAASAAIAAEAAAVVAQGEAQGAATTALTNAGAAGTSATNAASSASTATTRAAAALVSQGAAATSATNAAASTTAAATSATNAATQAGNSATSATASNTARAAAETARTQAQTARTAAETAQADAVAQASAAAGSATTAAGHATTSTTHADEAAGSATAAAGSASVASTQAGQASTSASNAATSETNALGSRNAAATSATTAAGSATTAGNSAAAAATSATTAATQATNAGNSATAANTSAVNAASSFTNTVISGGNQGFEDGAVGWNPSVTAVGPATTSWAAAASFEGQSNVLVATTPSRPEVYSTKMFPIVAGRKYRVRSRFWTGAGTGVSRTYFGIVCLKADGSHEGSNNGRLYTLPGTSYAAGTGWTEHVSGPLEVSSLVAYPNTTQVRLMARLNYDINTDIEVALDGIWLEDVTESEAALASATAASTSASAANTSATAAGSSATAANTSATNASTSAGAASTSASNAATSAQTADTHRASAATQAGLAAGSATAAGGSATAASGSASAANTSATEAGNSATSAQASSVSAGSSFNAAAAAASSVFPEAISGDWLTRDLSGNPATRASAPNGTGTIANGVWTSQVGFSTPALHKAVVPWATGKIYEVQAEMEVIAGAGGHLGYVYFFTLKDNYEYSAGTNQGGFAQNLTVGQRVIITRRFGMGVTPVGGTQITNTAGDNAFIRFGGLFNYGSAPDRQSKLYRVSVKDVTALVAAETEAAAASTSASAAATSASAAGTSASTSTTQAGLASTSAGQASTSATTAANSATTATGAANTATTQAGLAATSAGQAGGSATAANTSAGTAATHATNAGNSATSANNSSVSAASSFAASNLLAAMMLPDRTDAEGSYFYRATGSSTYGGAPPTKSMSPSDVAARITTETGYGTVIDMSGSVAMMSTQGVAPASAGKVYEVTSEWNVTDYAGSTVTLRNYLLGLDGDYGYVAARLGTGTVTAAGVFTLTTRFSEATSPGASVWTAGCVWLRFAAYRIDAAGSTVLLRRLSVRDVTEVAAAEAQAAAATASANAASTSASNASTSATAAGTSATAANTSAVNASTSAGAASTSASNAASSATTASGHAGTATTQAGLASTSAGAAGGSATAAGNSAGSASTSATNAGNSATSAAASSVSAASSYGATTQVAGLVFPEIISADLWSTVRSTTPSASASLPTASVSEEGYTSSGSAGAWVKQDVRYVQGRIYELSMDVEGLEGTTYARFYPARLGDDYLHLGDVTGGIHTPTPTGTVTTITQRYAMGVDLADAVKIPHSISIKRVRFGAIFNRNIAGGGADAPSNSRLQRFRISDVTEVVEAETQAAAASTSATAAATSATASGTSATAANTSATNASTSAGQAGVSASNSANSATSAQGSANTATTQAGLAATSAGAAGGSATAANTSAGTAATHATNAGNSATAANNSSISAASSYANTVIAGGNQGFEDGLTGWSASVTSQIAINGATHQTAFEDRFNVAVVASGVRGTFFSRKRFEIDTTRKYRVRGRFWTSAGTGTNKMYIGFRSFDSAGTATHTNNQYVAVGGSTFAAGSGWTEVVSGVLTGASFYAGTTALNLMSYTNYDQNGTIQTALDGIWLEDVTESEAALASASAASTSASNASTSASAAGTSASASESSRLAAGVSAGNASTSASTASTAATTATNQAAAASTSATIAAAIGLGSMNQNPMFTDWPTQTGQTPPVGWAEWTASEGILSRVAGINGSPNALRVASSSAANHGFLASPYAMGASPDGEYLVAEVDFTLVSGNLTGAAIYVEGRNASSGITSQSRGFATSPDATGVVRGAGVVGSTYHYRCLLDPRAAGVDRYQIIAMNRWSSFGPIGACTIDWHRVSIRPATPEEVQAGIALPALAASVSTTQAVVADLETQYELARYEVVADTGGGTARMRLVSDTYGTEILLDADNIKFGGNTVFDNGVDVLVTTTGSVSRIIAWGTAFGTEGVLTEWEGPSSVTWGNHSRANAHFYRANVAPYAGGSAFGTAPTFKVTPSHSGISKAAFTTGNITTDTVTLTPTNHTGSMTYSWQNIFGDTSMIATSSTGAATAFRADPPAGGMLQSIFAWTATDSGTGLTETGQVYVTIIQNV